VKGSYPGEVTVEHVDNPRVEKYDHYYKVVHTALPSLGLKPTLLAESLIGHMYDVVERFKDRVDPAALGTSTVKWAATSSELPRTSELARAK
jgi:UDP-sulfoquinovose synthase